MTALIIRAKIGLAEITSCYTNSHCSLSSLATEPFAPLPSLLAAEYAQLQESGSVHGTSTAAIERQLTWLGKSPLDPSAFSPLHYLEVECDIGAPAVTLGQEVTQR